MSDSDENRSEQTHFCSQMHLFVSAVTTRRCWCCLCVWDLGDQNYMVFWGLNSSSWDLLIVQRSLILFALPCHRQKVQESTLSSPMASCKQTCFFFLCLTSAAFSCFIGIEELSYIPCSKYFQVKPSETTTYFCDDGMVRALAASLSYFYLHL